jgi:hypothetical protein
MLISGFVLLFPREFRSSAGYGKQDLQQLQAINLRLEEMCYQTRMLLDFKSFGSERRPETIKKGGSLKCFLPA